MRLGRNSERIVGGAMVKCNWPKHLIYSWFLKNDNILVVKLIKYRSLVSRDSGLGSKASGRSSTDKTHQTMYATLARFTL